MHYIYRILQETPPRDLLFIYYVYSYLRAWVFPQTQCTRVLYDLRLSTIVRLCVLYSPSFSPAPPFHPRPESRVSACESVREFSSNTRDICIRASKHDTTLSVCMQYRMQMRTRKTGEYLCRYPNTSTARELQNHFGRRSFL